MRIAKIAINIPVYKYFDYRIPDKLSPKPGDFVMVPFGPMKKIGVIVDIEEKEVNFEIKDIVFILKEGSLTPLQLKLGHILYKRFLNSAGPSYFFMKISDTKDVKKYYKISEKGKESLNDNKLKEIKRKILNLLIDKEYTRKGVQRFIKWKGLPYLLNSMVKEGLLEVKERYKENKTSKILYIQMKDPGKKIELNADEKKIIQFLDRYENWCPFTFIRKKFHTVKKDLNKLEKAGILEFKYFENIMDSYLDPCLRQKQVEKLTSDQNEAYEKITAAIEKGKYKEFLISGVTGSGKTEVYFRNAIEAVNKGKKVLIGVPEISLTPQITALFKSYFGSKVIVYHSKLTQVERKNVNQTIRAGNFDILIGPRSIFFLPYKNIGLIVMDEFQDDSYNQDQQEPYYNGIYIARTVAEAMGIPLIFISATPLLETFYNVKNNKVNHFFLGQRAVKGSSMPNIEIVNMSEERDYILSRRLKDAVEKTVNENKQVMLFYNRRGFFRNIRCNKCGYVFKCESCDVPLIYHKDSNSLVCHYCGKNYPIPKKCPQCGNYHLSWRGLGIEQVEEKLETIFPNFSIARLDQDVSRDILKVQEIFSKFKAGTIDILLGTQIIAKGLDFSNVTLVGVISTEILFSIPNFRTSERAYSLLTQVAGRSGRGVDKGKVIIQTYNPSNEIISYALSNDYEKFYNFEIKVREKLSFPPFKNLAKIIFRDKKEETILKNAKKVKLILDAFNIEAYGPMPSMINKVKDYYFYEIVFKYDDYEKIYPTLKEIKASSTKLRFLFLNS